MKNILLSILFFVVFAGGVKLGETGKKIEVVRVTEKEYCPISWWFKDNALYWAFDGKFEPENYLKFQLDRKLPPTINQEPIRNIIVFPDRVVVNTKDKYWVVHSEGDIFDWYVEDYKIY